MITTALFFFSFLSACGEKNPAAVSPAADSGPKISMSVPDGGKAFVTQLIGSTTKNFAPTDSDGATFEYTKLQFTGDGTWTAEGYVEAMDEKMECTESGTWTIESVSSKTVATLVWTLGDTTCVGRDQGAETRAQVTVGSGGIETALFR
jgi:hypothetical protein